MKTGLLNQRFGEADHGLQTKAFLLFQGLDTHHTYKSIIDIICKTSIIDLFGNGWQWAKRW